MTRLKKMLQAGTIISLIGYREKNRIEYSLRTVNTYEIGVPQTIDRITGTGFYVSKTFVHYGKSKNVTYNNDDSFTVVSRYPDGVILSERTYKVLEQPKPRIIYTTH